MGTGSCGTAQVPVPMTTVSPDLTPGACPHDYIDDKNKETEAADFRLLVIVFWNRSKIRSLLIYSRVYVTG